MGTSCAAILGLHDELVAPTGVLVPAVAKNSEDPERNSFSNTAAGIPRIVAPCLQDPTAPDRRRVPGRSILDNSPRF